MTKLEHCPMCGAATGITADVVIPPAPPECETEDEKTAYAFGYWQGLHATRTTDAAGKDSKTPPDQSSMPPSACTAPATDQRPNIESVSAPAADGQALPVVRGSHIKASMFHDAGAVARCSYCRRYSDDPATLSDRQPLCDCGKRHGWCGSFVAPTADSKWSGASPVSAPEPAPQREMLRECMDAVDEAQGDPGRSAEYRRGYFDAFGEVSTALVKLREHLKDDKAGGAGVVPPGGKSNG